MTAVFNPDNFLANAENVFGRTISRNMLCLPKESPIAVTNFEEITSPDVTY
ncbi:MAG: hypothetical protein VW405_12455 [Rhodospirillaceae bacterium]